MLSFNKSIYSIILRILFPYKKNICCFSFCWIIQDTHNTILNPPNNLAHIKKMDNTNSK